MTEADWTVEDQTEQTSQPPGENGVGAEIRGLVANRRQPRTERALAALGDEDALGPQHTGCDAGHHAEDEGAGAVALLAEPDALSPRQAEGDADPMVSTVKVAQTPVLV